MTCINVRAKAESLGVRLEDVMEGRRKVAKYLSEHKDGSIEQREIDAVKTLPANEMIAVIRMGNLDRFYPGSFTKDGIRE